MGYEILPHPPPPTPSWLAPIGPLHDPVTWHKITYIYWWASCAVGLPKQRQVHCFGVSLCNLLTSMRSMSDFVTGSWNGPQRVIHSKVCNWHVLSRILWRCSKNNFVFKLHVKFWNWVGHGIYEAYFYRQRDNVGYKPSFWSLVFFLK